jgi:hypothetical protein
MSTNITSINPSLLEDALTLFENAKRQHKLAVRFEDADMQSVTLKQLRVAQAHLALTHQVHDERLEDGEVLRCAKCGVVLDLGVERSDDALESLERFGHCDA